MTSSGVEAMVVAIDGTTDRPDGSTYHITWSLGDGRRARESNDVLQGTRLAGARPPDPDRAASRAASEWRSSRICSSIATACSPTSTPAPRLSLGMTPEIVRGTPRPRRILEAPRPHGNFYGDLKQMPDAQILFQAVKHLKPTILTGIPLGTWAAPQKGALGGEAFPGRADHHHPGAQEASAHGAAATCWSTTAKTTGILGSTPAASSSTTRMRRTAPPAGEDLPVSERGS